MKRTADGNIFLPEFARVKEKQTMTPTETLLRVRLEDGGELGHRPGQFIQFSIFGVGEAPISVASSPTRGFCSS